MFVTRPLSELMKYPKTLETPTDGPNSGYLVIQDQDDEPETLFCYGCCTNRRPKGLPFPQNKKLTVKSVRGTAETTQFSLDPVYLIPVLNQPLSSNRYYAIVPHGKHKGQAFTCSREEDKITCCFFRCTKDVEPRPLDPKNIYQQFQISPYGCCCTPGFSFFATSLALDGFPPYFLRRQGWSIYTKTPRNLSLATAQGLDSELRAHPPEFRSSVSSIVGKWYTPFVFVKEVLTLKEQVKISLYYEITLEQKWERIFACNNDGTSSSVVVDGFFDKEEAFIGGGKATWDEKNDADGVVWFRIYNGEMGIALRREIVERMKWEEKRGGWDCSGGRQVEISKVEEFLGDGKWSEFGCYVLVERFNLKRLDGSLVLCYDFKHFDKMKTTWE